MAESFYNFLVAKKKEKKKLFAVLIDPDKFNANIIPLAEKAGVDFFLVGGSLLINNGFAQCIDLLKSNSKIPVIIFPGNPLQVSKKADGILFLSLISGRNADMLIGNQVIAAPVVKASEIEVLSTGYMLIESGKTTAALYMSNTHPIPYDQDNIALSTAMAGEMLGLKLIYMDAGSGAEKTVSMDMIKKVSAAIHIPLIIGGGINSAKKASDACKAGADIIVIGNAFEKDLMLIEEISTAIHQFNN